MSHVILRQLLQAFSSSLSVVQMKDKMVLSCLELKQNSFKLLKQSMSQDNTEKIWAHRLIAAGGLGGL